MYEIIFITKNVIKTNIITSSMHLFTMYSFMHLLANRSLACSMVLGNPSRMKPWFWHGLECSLSLKNLITWESSIFPVSWFLDCSISLSSSWASCAFPSSSSWSSESARLDSVCCQKSTTIIANKSVWVSFLWPTLLVW